MNSEPSHASLADCTFVPSTVEDSCSWRCHRPGLVLLTMIGALSTQLLMAEDDRVELTEVRNIDGSGNSIGRATNTPLLRKSFADYPDDGSGTTMIQ